MDGQKKSAGMLVCRMREGRLEVLLVHPGGPFFARKDEGAWTVPKGLPEQGEALLDAARRELREETGLSVDAARPCRPIGEVKQKGGKVVVAWAVASDFDPRNLVSNTFEMEWPPRSGRRQRFPEVDRAGWFGIEAARAKINPAQRPFLERAAEDETRAALFAEG